MRTPLVSLLTTPPFHACSFAMSIVGLPGIVMPMSSECPIFSYVFAAWITALDGMQPTLRHTPPQYSRSMMAVFTLSCAETDSRGIAAGAGTDHDCVET